MTFSTTSAAAAPVDAIPNSRLQTGQRFLAMFTLESFVDGEHITLRANGREAAVQPDSSSYPSP